MEIAEFVDVRRPRWVALESLLDQAEVKGLKSLGLDEARSLSRLYRSASSDLLWVRSRAGAADVSGYLNDLVGRAYALTYPGKPARWIDVQNFLVHGFPEVMRAEWRAYVASVLVFLAGFGFGWVGMVFDPDAAPYLVPDQHQSMDPTERVKDEADRKASVEEQAAFSSFLFTHNIQVAFAAFALGLTAGVGTAIMLLTWCRSHRPFRRLSSVCSSTREMAPCVPSRPTLPSPPCLRRSPRPTSTAMAAWIL